MASNWIQLSDESHETSGDYTVFTFTVMNTNIIDDEDDVELNPIFGSWQSLIFVNYEATRGTYDYITNTWTINNLAPEEIATLTVTTEAVEIPEVDAPTSTDLNDILKSKLIGQKVILKTKVGDEYYAMAKSATATTGSNVLIRDTRTCGKVTTGMTSRPATNTNEHGEQNTTGLNSGANECTYPPGDNGDEPSPDNPDPNKYTTPVECPGANLPMPDGQVECPTEPPTDADCMLEFHPGQVKAANQYSKGINGGNLYHVSFQHYGLDGLWIYPGADKPVFYLDITIAKEPETDDRGAVPDCWAEGGAMQLLNTCNDEEGNPGKFKCVSGCCMWPGDTDFTSLFSNVCPEGPSHYGVIWHNKPGEKFQFFYPYGALWIFVKKAGVAGDGKGMTYPTGYTYRDGNTPWSIVGGADYVFGIDSDDYKPDYDPDHGGKGGNFGNRMDYNTCMEQLKIQVPNDTERDAICKESTQGEDQTGWTDCMKRLYSKNPNITAEEAATMCNEHPDWTTCMINMFYSTGETMTEDELEIACKGQGDSHTIQFYVGLDPEPFLITDMAFWVGGTSTCSWGWPGISLWFTDPAASIGKLRVCMPTEEDLQTYKDIGDRER